MNNYNHQISGSGIALLLGIAVTLLLMIGAVLSSGGSDASRTNASGITTPRTKAQTSTFNSACIVISVFGAIALVLWVIS